jgi:hypothetical protein
MASKGTETSDTQTKTITQQSINPLSSFSSSFHCKTKLNLKQNAIKIFLHLFSGPTTTTSLYCPASCSFSDIIIIDILPSTNVTTTTHMSSSYMS